MEKVIKLTALAALPAMAFAVQTAQAAEQKQPNVIFYMIEDTSPQYMALYNDGKGAPTPNLEKAAKQSITYTNAFSAAPVSSAARTSLITGCYAPRFGGSLHRRLEELPMPEGLRMYPSYLRDAGYYTINASKTDYNVVLDETAWDQISGKLGDWNKRESSDQPFFMCRTNAITHESKLLFNEETYNTVETKTDPNSVYVHPNLPQTDLMKYTYATFYDRIKDADDEFGEMMDMLKKDGLLDDTFVFFFGDNGGCVPESKGYTNDVGFRVPLVVYVPKNYRDLVGLKLGESTDGMVSFIDFGPTVMRLAGIEQMPSQMNGVPFLGEGADEAAHESLVCYGDRFDDLYAFNRVLYRGDFRYARNYTPYHMQGLHSYYRYKSLALTEARNMYHAGELNELQSIFFEPLGGEHLYDLKNDPNETRNLANDPAYRDQLLAMRNELAIALDNYCDLGFLPETIINEEAMENPAAWGESHQKELAYYRMVADLQLAPLNGETARKLKLALNSDDTVAQWWGLTSSASFGDQMSGCADYASTIEELTKSYNRSFVRSRAFVAGAKIGREITEADVKDMLQRSRTLGEVLLVLNDMAYLHNVGILPALNLTEEDTPFVNYSVEERVSFLNSEFKL
ncbi:MAG: sulfatase [Rikenellaceae bacterium]